jgi:hypothetical protein
MDESVVEVGSVEIWTAAAGPGFIARPRAALSTELQPPTSSAAQSPCDPLELLLSFIHPRLYLTRHIHVEATSGDRQLPPRLAPLLAVLDRYDPQGAYRVIYKRFQLPLVALGKQHLLS